MSIRGNQFAVDERKILDIEKQWNLQKKSKLQAQLQSYFSCFN